MKVRYKYMFTKNFKKILTRAIFNSSTMGSDRPSLSEGFTMMGATGTEITPFTNPSSMSAFINVFNNPYTTSSGEDAYNKIFCRLGTGTTAATEDDYWLETQDDNLTCSSAVASETDSNTKVYTFTFNNPTSENISITETALGIKLNSNVLRENSSIMLDRTVLDTPITFSPGETKAIIYEIGF